jgi:hypothetical protein
LVLELSPLTSLTSLTLRGCESLGSAALLAITTCCPALRHLDLEGTGVGHRLGLQMLTSLTHLTYLGLGSTGVSAGLQLLQFSRLRALDLGGCEDVQDEDLRHVLTGTLLPRLSWLDLRGTAVGDGSLAGLSALGKLRALGLDQCSRVSPAGLAALAQLPKLWDLSLSFSARGAAPAQLAQLAELTRLSRLALKGHAIGREAAAALLALPRLASLAAASIAAGAGRLQPGGGPRPCLPACCPPPAAL